VTIGGEGPGSRDVIFRQTDCDRWRRSRLSGPLLGDSPHSSLTEFARSFGLLEAVCDKVLISRPPFGFLCLSIEG